MSLFLLRESTGGVCSVRCSWLYMSDRAIGRFELKSVLGKGSMGVVHRAHDPELERDVAIKLVRLPEGIPENQQSSLTQNLLKEARVVARLRHPGIVSVFDCGRHDNAPYLVMEYIEGKMLSTLLKEQGALELETVGKLIEELIEAMAHAHEQGVVHLDLKPANIMLEDNGRIRIMDFGIARTVADIGGKKKFLAGTPRYMAPEQIMNREVDPRTDVWAIGVICYEMLTGGRPFEQADFNALKGAITSSSPTPLSTLREEIPPAMLEFVDRCLRKRPESRFPDCAGMIDQWRTCKAQTRSEKISLGGAENLGKEQIAEYIIERIKRKGDLPSCSRHMDEVKSKIGDHASSAYVVAESILKDYSLTNRLLRMVNSPYYRGAGQEITTVSRAVVVIGMETVLNVASGLLMFEHFHKHTSIKAVKQQTIEALMTGMHARRVAQHLELKNPEEGFICGMLHHLGRLIVMFYFADEYADIQRLTSAGTYVENEACKKVMRLDYMEIASVVTQSWNLPTMHRQAMHGLDPNHEGNLNSELERFQATVSFADGLAKATMTTDPEKRDVMLMRLQRAFSEKIKIPMPKIKEQIKDTVRNAWDISHDLRVDLKEMGVAESILNDSEEDSDNELPLQSSGDAPIAIPGDDRVLPGQVDNEFDPLDDSASPSMRMIDLDDSTGEHEGEQNILSPGKRADILMKTIGEITAAMMDDFELNDILMMVLEGIFRGVGFHHVTLCMVTPGRESIRYRFGLGPRVDDNQQIFNISLSNRNSLIARCVETRREIIAPELNDPRKRELFPPDWLEVLEPTSIIILPLVVQDSTIGLFVMDRNKDFGTLDQTEIRNVRTLCRQATLAIAQTLKRKR